MAKDIQKILLVDDEVEILKAIKRHLSRTGFIVSSANNTEEAQHKIEESAQGDLPFDLVITDILMPGGSGLDLSHWLKERYPETSVLFISGFGVSDLVTDAVESQRADFCQKPFAPSELLATIHRIDQKRRKKCKPGPAKGH